MTSDQITRLCYAFAIGWLSGVVWSVWPGVLISLAIIFAGSTIGALFGKDRP